MARWSGFKQANASKVWSWNSTVTWARSYHLKKSSQAGNLAMSLAKFRFDCSFLLWKFSYSKAQKIYYEKFNEKSNWNFEFAKNGKNFSMCWYSSKILIIISHLSRKSFHPPAILSSLTHNFTLIYCLSLSSSLSRSYISLSQCGKQYISFIYIHETIYHKAMQLMDNAGAGVNILFLLIFCWHFLESKLYCFLFLTFAWQILIYF